MHRWRTAEAVLVVWAVVMRMAGRVEVRRRIAEAEAVGQEAAAPRSKCFVNPQRCLQLTITTTPAAADRSHLPLLRQHLVHALIETRTERTRGVVLCERRPADDTDGRGDKEHVAADRLCLAAVEHDTLPGGVTWYGLSCMVGMRLVGVWIRLGWVTRLQPVKHLLWSDGR